MILKPPFIDTHCHLTDSRFQEDLPEVLERSRDAGVATLITIGDTLESSRAACHLCNAISVPGLALYCAIGVHPHDAKHYDAKTAEALRDLARAMLPTGRLVALGEIGLDFYYDNSPRDLQRRAFLEQAALGRELGLPLIIHCRDAYPLLIELAEQEPFTQTGAAVHCFSGTAEEAEQLARLGFYLGVDGPITFKKNEAGRAALRCIPLDRLLLETDAPYLSPVPKRGKRNEPAYLTYLAQRISEEIQVPLENLARKTSENAHRLFGIPVAPLRE